MRLPIPNIFLRPTKMVWHPFVKGFILMYRYILFPHRFFSVLRISPHTPLSARSGRRYLQIKMYVISGPTTENVLSVPELSFHAILSKSLSRSFPGRLVWTETLGKQWFFTWFWPFKWVVFFGGVHLTFTAGISAVHQSNEKNHQRTRFSSYSMIK